MKRAVSLVIPCLLLACSGPPLARGVKPPEEATRLPGPATGQQAIEPVSGCPGDYDRLSRMRGCINPDARQCDYPEARCHCLVPPQCGGIEQPYPPDEGVWRCEHPSCPPDVPLSGGRCDTPDSVRCTYGECSWSQAIAACIHGVWDVQRVEESPPP
jgi:hypothetical protein